MAHGVERFLTFDCYGTLIDWESGIHEAFARAANGASLSRDEVLRAYAAIEPAVESGGFRSYREVLGETAARVAKQFALPVGDPSFLAASLPEWKPFPDTNAALRRLRAAGFRLGILSNVDDDLLAATRRHLDVDFDLIVTAQQVRSYKPAHGHFLAARDAIGGAVWIHAAQSNFHDIVPANALGIGTAWINRRGEKPLEGGVPNREFRDLAALADWLTGS